MLKKRQFIQLLHDIKRVSKGIKLITNEEDKEKRELIGSLLGDEVDRLFQDLEEANENGKKKNGDN